MKIGLADLVSFSGVQVGTVEATLELPGSEIIGSFAGGRLWDLEIPYNTGAGIYVISFDDNQQVYVGSTKCLWRRHNLHKHYFVDMRQKNKPLQAGYNLYGKDGTYFHYFSVPSQELALDVEQILLDMYFAEGSLLNISPTSRSAMGVKHSEESRENMRTAALLRPPLSQESRDKISVALKGKPLAAEHAAKLAAKNQARWADPEFRAHWASKRKRAVVIDGIHYPSMSEAGLAHGLIASGVQKRIISTKEKYDGWKYA